MTSVYITKKTNMDELVKIMLEASFSGERFLVQMENGASFGIVPNEDLNVLEEIDPSNIQE
jgi:hypothetical protein